MRACANPYFVDAVGRNGLWQDAAIRWSAVMDTVKARARNNELADLAVHTVLDEAENV